MIDEWVSYIAPIMIAGTGWPTVTAAAAWTRLSVEQPTVTINRPTDGNGAATGSIGGVEYEYRGVKPPACSGRSGTNLVTLSSGCG
ncbi:hypothetical protein WP50_33210 [Lactiplantibacillus plantarum]|nr:hypothetical protein WP50_33210 [Lactiplantibacillus plantarum]